jgi:hypothetical protein
MLTAWEPKGCGCLAAAPPGVASRKFEDEHLWSRQGSHHLWRPRLERIHGGGIPAEHDVAAVAALEAESLADAMSRLWENHLPPHPLHSPGNGRLGMKPADCWATGKRWGPEGDRPLSAPRW